MREDGKESKGGGGGGVGERDKEREVGGKRGWWDKKSREEKRKLRWALSSCKKGRRQE